MTVINFFNFRCEIFFLCFCCSSSAKKIMVIRIQCTKSYFLQHPVIKILKKSSQVKKIWFEMIPFRVCVCVCVCVCVWDICPASQMNWKKPFHRCRGDPADASLPESPWNTMNHMVRESKGMAKEIDYALYNVWVSLWVKMKFLWFKPLSEEK